MKSIERSPRQTTHPLSSGAESVLAFHRALDAEWRRRLAMLETQASLYERYEPEDFDGA